MLGLTPKDLFDQVVHDVSVIAGESIDEPGNVLSSLHGERRQLEPRHPAFGPRLQGRYVICREVQPHHVVEETQRPRRG